MTIADLAVLDYDHNDMNLAAYDWRLSYINLETRDSVCGALSDTLAGSG